DGWGLVACGRHAGLEAIETGLAALAADAEALGTPRLIVSWIEPPQTSEQALVVVERLRTAAEHAAAAGVELGFHNHDAEVQELDGGRSVLDELLELAPELL